MSMWMIPALLAVSILIAAGVALWRHGPWARAEIGRGLCLVALLAITVVVTEAAIRDPEGTPEAFMWGMRALLAPGLVFLWLRWFRADWSRRG